MYIYILINIFTIIICKNRFLTCIFITWFFVAICFNLQSWQSRRSVEIFEYYHQPC